MWRTGGKHELDLCNGRCRHCKRLWSLLYPPPDESTSTGESLSHR